MTKLFATLGFIASICMAADSTWAASRHLTPSATLGCNEVDVNGDHSRVIGLPAGKCLSHQEIFDGYRCPSHVILLEWRRERAEWHFDCLPVGEESQRAYLEGKHRSDIKELLAQLASLKSTPDPTATTSTSLASTTPPNGQPASGCLRTIKVGGEEMRVEGLPVGTCLKPTSIAGHCPSHIVDAKTHGADKWDYYCHKEQ